MADPCPRTKHIPIPRRFQIQVQQPCEPPEGKKIDPNAIFGIRNKKLIPLKDGVNYTMETLSYATPKILGDMITKSINIYMKKASFEVWECCSGIGGNTMSFLDVPNVTKVIAHEIDPFRQRMLKTNLEMYGFSPVRYEVRGAFEGIEGRGKVLYMDPPWLPPDIQGHLSTRDQYILSGIKVGDLTIEEWVIQTTPSLAVVRVPPGFSLGNIRGYAHRGVNTHKSLLLFIVPLGDESFEEEEEEEEDFEAARAEKREPAKVINYRKARDIDEDEQKWKTSLVKFLREEILPKTGTKKDMIESLISPSKLEKYWYPAFTHRTWDRDRKGNYETLEFLGDSAFKITFTSYLTDRFKNDPTVEAQEMTNWGSYYAAKRYQARVSDQLKLPRHARTLIQDVNVSEDLLESFYGALYHAGEDLKRGFGYALATNFTISIFKGVTFDPELGRANIINRVKEIFEKLHLPVEHQDMRRNSDGRNIHTIFLPEETVTNMQKVFSISLHRNTFHGEGGSKSSAKEEAHRELIEYLKTFNITLERIDVFARERDRQLADVKIFWTAAMEKSRQEGFQDLITVKEDKKQKTSKKILQLVGVREARREKEILVTVIGDFDKATADMEVTALQIYSQGRKGTFYV